MTTFIPPITIVNGVPCYLMPAYTSFSAPPYIFSPNGEPLELVDRDGQFVFREPPPPPPRQSRPRGAGTDHNPHSTHHPSAPLPVLPTTTTTRARRAAAKPVYSGYHAYPHLAQPTPPSNYICQHDRDRLVRTGAAPAPSTLYGYHEEYKCLDCGSLCVAKPKPTPNGTQNPEQQGPSSNRADDGHSSDSDADDEEEGHDDEEIRRERARYDPRPIRLVSSKGKLPPFIPPPLQPRGVHFNEEVICYPYEKPIYGIPLGQTRRAQSLDPWRKRSTS